LLFDPESAGADSPAQTALLTCERHSRASAAKADFGRLIDGEVFPDKVAAKRNSEGGSDHCDWETSLALKRQSDQDWEVTYQQTVQSDLLTNGSQALLSN
jgi:hypothetical protein